MAVTPHEELLADLNPAQREAVLHVDGPLLVVAGAGLREDPRPHPPRRAPDPRARREAERDPRDHVHEQGRGGDARAARAHARRARRARSGSSPSTPPAAGSCGARRSGSATARVHDLRPGRPGAPRQGVPRGARQGPEALHAARDPRPDLEREESAHLARGVRLARRLVLGPDRRRGVRALPAQALRLERGRLRRHADADRPGARAVPGGARRAGSTPSATCSSTSTRTRTTPSTGSCSSSRRSTGTCSRSATRTRASMRFAAPTSATSSTSSATSAGPDRRAGAELPLDERDPRGRQRGDRQQPGPQAEAALVGARGGRSGRGRRGRGRARRGALRRRRDRAPGRVGRVRVRDRGLLSHERAVARARGRARPAGGSVPGDRRAALLRAGRDQGRRRVPGGAEQLHRRGLADADREPPAARDRRYLDPAARPARRRARDLALGGDGGSGGGRSRRGELPRDQGLPGR